MNFDYRVPLTRLYKMGSAGRRIIMFIFWENFISRCAERWLLLRTVARLFDVVLIEDP